jgi:hypothetical protein
MNPLTVNLWELSAKVSMTPARTAPATETVFSCPPANTMTRLPARLCSGKPITRSSNDVFTGSRRHRPAAARSAGFRSVYPNRFKLYFGNQKVTLDVTVRGSRGDWRMSFSQVHGGYSLERRYCAAKHERSGPVLVLHPLPRPRPRPDCNPAAALCCGSLLDQRGDHIRPPHPGLRGAASLAHAPQGEQWCSYS